MQEYLLALLAREAETPTVEETLNLAGSRAGGRAGFKTASDSVRADRDSH